jgi:hypothetical protein
MQGRAGGAGGREGGHAPAQDASASPPSRPLPLPLPLPPRQCLAHAAAAALLPACTPPPTRPAAPGKLPPPPPFSLLRPAAPPERRPPPLLLPPRGWSCSPASCSSCPPPPAAAAAAAAKALLLRCARASARLSRWKALRLRAALKASRRYHTPGRGGGGEGALAVVRGQARAAAEPHSCRTAAGAPAPLPPQLQAGRGAQRQIACRRRGLGHPARPPTCPAAHVPRVGRRVRVDPPVRPEDRRPQHALQQGDGGGGLLRRARRLQQLQPRGLPLLRAPERLVVVLADRLVQLLQLGAHRCRVLQRLRHYGAGARPPLLLLLLLLLQAAPLRVALRLRRLVRQHLRGRGPAP